MPVGGGPHFDGVKLILVLALNANLNTSDRLRRSHNDAVLLRLLQVEVQDRSIMHAVTAAYPQSTLNSTLTGSSLSSTASYETYVAGQEESGCVLY